MMKSNPYKAEIYLLEAREKWNSYFIDKLSFRNYISLWKVDEAIKLWEEILESIDNINDKEEIYYALSNLYFWKKDYKKSYENLGKCISISENSSQCNLWLSKFYFYSWADKNIWLVKLHLEKSILFDMQNSLSIEFLWIIKEYEEDYDGALSSYLNALKNFVDKDSNLFENEKEVIKQRLYINISRLYSLKENKNNSLYYLEKFKDSNKNIKNILYLTEKINNWDFDYIINNSDLSDYIDIWWNLLNFYNNKPDEDINKKLYNSIYYIVIDKKSFRKIDLEVYSSINNIKTMCDENISLLDNNLKVLCKLFVNSNNFINKSSNDKEINVRELFNNK